MSTIQSFILHPHVKQVDPTSQWASRKSTRARFRPFFFTWLKMNTEHLSPSHGSVSVSYTGLCTEVGLPVICRRFLLSPDPQHGTAGRFSKWCHGGPGLSVGSTRRRQHQPPPEFPMTLSARRTQTPQTGYSYPLPSDIKWVTRWIDRKGQGGQGLFSSTVHLQAHMGTEAIIENLLYWAVKGEHDTFYFGSVSTTKHALNPLKKKKKRLGPCRFTPLF